MRSVFTQHQPNWTQWLRRFNHEVGLALRQDPELDPKIISDLDNTKS